MNRRALPALTIACLMTATPALAQACGGDFAAWRSALVDEARGQGIGQKGLDALASAQIDPAVIRRDRAQGIFTLDFLTFSQRLISQNRLDNGRANLRRHAGSFERAVSEFGVSPEVITAFWAFETDYGAVQGDFNTLNALATLAHDCRRPELFRPQVLALGQLIDMDVVPRNVTGAWAGEIGQIQVLPEDYLTKGRDGDGDGRINMKTSAADAIITAANFLSSLGWQPNQPWLVEVDVPAQMEWFDAGIHRRLPVSEWVARGVTARNGTLDTSLEASLLLPKGRKGVAFLAYSNFNVLLEWNQSLTYVTTVAYFATRLGGAPIYDTKNPDTALTEDQMKDLQRRLQARGHDVGDIDGILGAGTRQAVRLEQQRLGLPADAWPTRALLAQL